MTTTDDHRTDDPTAPLTDHVKPSTLIAQVYRDGEEQYSIHVVRDDAADQESA